MLSTNRRIFWNLRLASQARAYFWRITALCSFSIFKRRFCEMQNGSLFFSSTLPVLGDVTTRILLPGEIPISCNQPTQFCYPFFFQIFKNWTLVYLQCRISFKCTAKWFSYTYIYTLFQILFHYRLLQDIAPCVYSLYIVFVIYVFYIL